MNKRFLILLSVLLVGGGLVWLVRWNNGREVYLPSVTDKDRIKAAARLDTKLPTQPEVVVQMPIAPSRPVRLAIGWLGLPDEAQNLQAADLLTAELSAAKGFELVERQSIERVIQELGLSYSGLVRAEQAVRVGKLLKADWFLLGTGRTMNGTNSVVVRLVDTRTGIMRDGAVFACDPGGSRVVGELASFVRRCRQDASQPRPRQYLALGSLEDLSVNSRQARFPTQLRGYLTAACQRTGITMLEREYVNTLLSEVHLDLAGLTEEGATNGPIPMQAAFWLVQGAYQSFETADHEVEVELTIRRMLGRSKQVRLRGNPDEFLFHEVKAAIDSAMQDPQLAVVPTRNNEIRAQMTAGRDLGQLQGPLMWMPAVTWRPTEEAMRKRNLEEAIRAFETVLLLDPANRGARIYLAACLRSWSINRVEEARNYYRQVIESPVQDSATGTAQMGLLNSFGYERPAARAAWYERAAQAATNSPAAAFYRDAAEKARADEIIGQSDNPKAQKLAEARLFEDLKVWHQNLLHDSYVTEFYETGLGRFAASFGTNAAAAAKRLAELLPSLQEQNPDLAPYILAGVVSFQVDTNAPVIAQFERAFDEHTLHPEKVFKSGYYFYLASGPVYSWCTAQKLFGLAAKVIEASLKVAPQRAAPALDPEKMMSLAFARIGAGRWQEALDIFLCYSNRPLAMRNEGLWGAASSAVLTAKEANLCREKLGLPMASDPREFSFGKPVFCLHTPSAFCVDDNILWIGLEGQLLQLDLDLHTNRVNRLPLAPSVPINSLSVTPSNILIGTGGGGLIEVNKATRECRCLTEADGLLMNYVGQAQAAEETVWVAYRSKTAGGLGKLDLRTRKATSFTPSLFSPANTKDGMGYTGSGPPDEPPRVPVLQIAPGRDGEVWFVQPASLRRFRSIQGLWETFTEAGPCWAVALAGDRLLVGRYANRGGRQDNQTGLLGLSLLDLRGGEWRHLPAQDGLPHESVTAVTADGQDVWLGGLGFIAHIGPDYQLRKYAYVRASSVDHIQVAGGWVWAQFDRHLHRVRLP